MLVVLVMLPGTTMSEKLLFLDLLDLCVLQDAPTGLGPALCSGVGATLTAAESRWLYARNASSPERYITVENKYRYIRAQ